MQTDSLEENGLKMAGPCKKTISQLKKSFPDRVVVSNPTDLTGDADSQMFKKAIDTLLKDKSIDALIVITLMQLPKMDKKMVGLLNSYTKSNKPVVVVSPPGKFSSKLNSGLKLPVFDSPEQAASALKTAYEATRLLK